ncbi:MAG: PIN domain-containing protein [Candidatus Jettenia caeni]|nr:PIN domain-containing protein [Candidatus Jettenia caeni]UJS16643.1 MAG: PIN domain-containing protein [Candidatus Jettenia sp.]
MTYIVDTHILIWYLDKNKRLKPAYHQILSYDDNDFVFSTIVLAEIKHLISLKRIKVDFDKVVDYLSESENCIIYPVDESVINEMPAGLSIHDALIVATGLVYKNILKKDVKILTEDEMIIQSHILPVA